MNLGLKATIRNAFDGGGVRWMRSGILLKRSPSIITKWVLSLMRMLRVAIS